MVYSTRLITLDVRSLINITSESSVPHSPCYFCSVRYRSISLESLVQGVSVQDNGIMERTNKTIHLKLYNYLNILIIIVYITCNNMLFSNVSRLLYKLYCLNRNAVKSHLKDYSELKPLVSAPILSCLFTIKTTFDKFHWQFQCILTLTVTTICVIITNTCFEKYVFSNNKVNK